MLQEHTQLEHMGRMVIAHTNLWELTTPNLAHLPEDAAGDAGSLIRNCRKVQLFVRVQIKTCLVSSVG
jgi:hypothetical protein